MSKEQTKSWENLNNEHLFYRKVVKRAIDATLATCSLVILSPLLGVVYVIAAKEMGRPVIFKQKRPGYHEKIFEMYKFRTMTDEKDADGNLLPDEKRLTKFGEFLRNTSIDELPQLVNIIKGDMAIIGPRALLVDYLPLYTKEQHHRHDVKPGLVGLAALHGRNNQSWDSKFKYDLKYARNVSFKLDWKVFLGAIKVTLSRDGVAEEGQATMERLDEYLKVRQSGVKFSSKYT
jgi:lipopolysaccharide/colanic/teichoic acid biosynthesis glycosyltransferase